MDKQLDKRSGQAYRLERATLVRGKYVWTEEHDMQLCMTEEHNEQKCFVALEGRCLLRLWRHNYEFDS